MTSILVIGDAHVDPDVPNTRFDWLGRFIADRLPDVIVQMGDWADMKSLSSYDRGKKDFQGRSYSQDIAAANDALKRIDKKIDIFNNTLRKKKKELYKPRKVAIGGNHDDARIERLIQLQPELEATVSIKDIEFEKFGWEYHAYEIPVEINGIWFCHHFPTGNSGEPIGGINLAQALVAKNMVSSVVGHSHVLDMAMRSTPGGKRIWGLSAGCFFDHKMKYAKATQERFWWSGLVLLKNVHDGDFSPEVITIDELKDIYG